MVDLETARQQAQQARQLVEQKRQEAESARQRLEQQRREIETQQNLRGQGIQQQAQRQQSLSNIRQGLGQIQSYQQNVLQPYSQQIQQTQSQIQSYNQKVADYKAGYNFGVRGIPLMNPTPEQLAGYQAGQTQADYQSSLSNYQSQQNLPALNYSYLNQSYAPPDLQSPPSNIQKALTYVKANLVGLPTAQRFSYEQAQQGLGFIDTAGGLIQKDPRLSRSETSDILAVGGLGFAGSVEAPEVLKIPTRTIKPASFTEVQRPFSIAGKEGVLSSYRIKQELSPPMVELGGEGGYLGYSDIPRVIPPRVEITQTALPVINEGNALTFSTRSSRSGQLGLVSGKSIPASIEELNRLSPTERYAWRGLAEQIAGRPVSYENVPFILNKDSQLTQSYIQAVKLGRYTRGNPAEARLFEDALKGTSTSRYVAVSQFEKSGQTPLYDTWTGKIVYKDITYPNARASGQTPVLEGTIIRVKEPLTYGEDTGVTVYRPTGKTKSSLQSLFSDSLVVTPKPVPKSLPKGTTTKLIKTTGGLEQYGKSGLLLGLSGGSFSGESIRNTFSDFSSGFNQGLLSRAVTKREASAKATTEQDFLTGFDETLGLTGKVGQFAPLMPKTMIKQKNIQSIKSMLNLKNVPDVILTNKQNLRLFNQNKLSPELATKMKSILKTRDLVQQRSAQKQFQSLLLRQESKTAQKYLTLSQVENSLEKSNPTKNNPVSVEIFPFKLPKIRGKKSLFSKEDMKGVFDVFVKTKGKNKKVKSFGTEKEAFNYLFGNLSRSLRASGFVASGGRKIKPRSLPSQFRSGKRDSFRVVERRRYRLDMPSEVNEIMSYPKTRKKKTRRKNAKINFFR